MTTPCAECERMNILQASNHGYAFTLRNPNPMTQDGWREIGDASDDGMYWRPCAKCRAAVT